MVAEKRRTTKRRPEGKLGNASSDNKALPDLRLLVVEDDERLLMALKDNFEAYGERVTVKTAPDAGEAMRILAEWNPNVVVLDLMMPYEDARAELNGKTDREQVETGIRLLEWIRKTQGRTSSIPVWVAVITARTDVRAVSEAARLLGKHGKLFVKPFNSLMLEHDIVSLAGIESRVPAGLLPEDYQAPKPLQGGQS